MIFDSDELKALEEASQPTIDIIAFMPLAAIDPIYWPPCLPTDRCIPAARGLAAS